MPTQIRPNWTLTGGVGNAPPNLNGFAVLAQPIPSADQSVTIIRLWGYLVSGVDVDAATLTFSLWDAATNEDGDVNAGIREISPEITVGTPAVAAMDPALNIPFFLQWVDAQQTQSGLYYVAFDDADAGATSGNLIASNLHSIAP